MRLTVWLGKLTSGESSGPNRECVCLADYDGVGVGVGVSFGVGVSSGVLVGSGVSVGFGVGVSAARIAGAE